MRRHRREIPADTDGAAHLRGNAETHYFYLRKSAREGAEAVERRLNEDVG